MNQEIRTCTNCQTSFMILPEDFEFYKRVKVAPPSICPRCGLQKVMSWRNERNLYTRKCDKCGKAGLSIYHPQAPYVVYCHDCWWKDDWSGKDYGMDYDPSRPLMDQFRELQSRVPRESMVIINSTNSDYGNQIRDSKDIYFCFLISLTENALYSMWITNGPKDVLDCHKVVGGERVAHCVDVSKCSGCAYLQDSTDSVDCYFSYGLKGCNNCLFSSNLRNKTNYVRNQQVSKEEFLAEKNKALSGSWSSLQKALTEYQEVKDKALRRFAEITKSSSVTGNYIEACGSCRFAFEGVNAEHCLAAISLINPKEAFFRTPWAISRPNMFTVLALSRAGRMSVSASTSSLRTTWCFAIASSPAPTASLRWG